MSTNAVMRGLSAALVLAALALTACSGPTRTGNRDAAQISSGETYMVRPTRPHDDTANSLGGRYIVGCGGG